MTVIESVDAVLAFGRDLLAMGDDDLARLLTTYTSHDLDLAEAAIAMAQREQQMGALEAAEWRATPATMAHHLSGGRTQLWPYVQLLGDQFKKAETGESKRQIWNVPAQYGKSTLASQWGPAWYLDQHPDHRLILTSYSDDLADSNAYAVRDILRTHTAQLRTNIRQDMRRRDRFLTDEGGGLLASSIDGGMTGWPAHGVVIDDPFKNWVTAHSPTTRANVWNQYRSVIRMRQTWDDFWIILVMTRWHEDDLSARLIKEMLAGGEKWEVIRLAEVAEAPNPKSPDYFTRLPDPLGRAPGEILEPRRFNFDTVADRRTAAGPYLWAGMHQQRPGPEEGGELKRAWWDLVETVPPAFDQLISSWDMKMKETKTGDFQSGQVWGRTGSGVWLLHHLHGQWNMPTVKAAIALTQVRFPEIQAHLIENTGNGPEVIKELREGRDDYHLSQDIIGELGILASEVLQVEAVLQVGMMGLLPQNPRDSKIARARAHVGILEAGDVHVLNTPGGVALIEQAASFPGGHDDMVDSWSQAMGYLRDSMAQVARPQGTIQHADPTERLNRPDDGAPRGSVRDPRAGMMPPGVRLSQITRRD